MKVQACIALLLSLAGLGCSSTGVGNPGKVELALGVDDQLEGSTDAGVDVSLPRGAVRNAIAVLGELRWLPCDTTLPAAVVPGPFVADFVTGRTQPEVPSVEAPRGGFCGIDAPLAPASAPPALVGRSLLFDGVRADGTFFLVYVDLQATLRLRAAPGVVWNAEATPALVWAFRPRRWLKPEELDAAETTLWDNRRVVIIDANRHPLLLLAIRARLAGRSTLYLDRNNSGTLDDDERGVELGQGSENAD